MKKTELKLIDEFLNGELDLWNKKLRHTDFSIIVNIEKDCEYFQFLLNTREKLLLAQISSSTKDADEIKIIDKFIQKINMNNCKKSDHFKDRNFENQILSMMEVLNVKAKYFQTEKTLKIGDMTYQVSDEEWEHINIITYDEQNNKTNYSFNLWFKDPFIKVIITENDKSESIEQYVSLKNIAENYFFYHHYNNKNVLDDRKKFIIESCRDSTIEALLKLYRENTHPINPSYQAFLEKTLIEDELGELNKENKKPRPKL